MRLRCESKGSSRRRGFCCASAPINAPLHGDNAPGRLGRIPENGPCEARAFGGRTRASLHKGQRPPGVDARRRPRAGARVAPAPAVGPRGIADARTVRLPAHEPGLTHGHLVLGQCAGLVRADDRGRAQRFDGGQAFDEGMVAGDALGPMAECEGHGGEQPFWHEGHNHPDGENAALHQGHPGQGDRQPKNSKPTPTAMRVTTSWYATISCCKGLVRLRPPGSGGPPCRTPWPSRSHRPRLGPCQWPHWCQRRRGWGVPRGSDRPGGRPQRSCGPDVLRP